jgi:L-asparaginase II
MSEGEGRQVSASPSGGVAAADPILVEVTRGRLVESRHRGAIAIVDGGGRRRAAIGDVGQRVFPRSAVKALQALPLVESGAADRYGFGNAELALACSSHNGEPRHVETAIAMLRRAGRGPEDLECGPQMPGTETAARLLIRAGREPGPEHNNCSGKHAGFVCVCAHRGYAVPGYVEPDHPVQREITAALAEVTGTTLDAGVRGVDGCSIPAYAIPLDRLALGFARFITGEGLSAARAAAARRLATACMAEPWMVAGSDRFCTRAMAKLPGRLFVKTGAEGVFCAALPEQGLGVAVKCDDGAGRASEALMAAVVAALLDTDGEPFAARPILSRRARVVGEIRPVSGLLEALREGGSLS